MATETREVTVCDLCKTHDDVSYWPQIGIEACDDCASDQFRNHHCKVCGDFDVNTGKVEEFRGQNTCQMCREEILEDEAMEEESDERDE